MLPGMLQNEIKGFFVSGSVNGKLPVSFYNIPFCLQK
jgi:hypothetical protein